MELTTSFISGALGTTAIFKDTTGTTAPDSYSKDGNIGYASVNAIRLKTATLSSIDSTATLNATAIFTRYLEYICTAGSGTIDGKAIQPGGYIVPSLAGLIVPTGMTFETTGNYVFPFLSTFLPNATEVALTISLAELNQSNNSVIEDSLYTLNYEIYNNQFTTNQAAVIGQQYMVIAGTCTYVGNTYRAGEIFIASDTNAITVSSSIVGKLYATDTSYHVVTYNMSKAIYELLPIADHVLANEIFGISVNLAALAFSSATGNVSYTYTQGLLNTLQDKVAYLTNNN